MSSKQERFRIAVLDDYQDVALSLADWSVLDARATVAVFNDHLADSDAANRAGIITRESLQASAFSHSQGHSRPGRANSRSSHVRYAHKVEAKSEYPDLVERLFNKIKQCRRVATRYDKLAANYLAFIQLASIRLWLRVNECMPCFSDTPLLIRPIAEVRG